MGTGDDNYNTKIIKVKTVNFIFKSQVNINYFCSNAQKINQSRRELKANSHVWGFPKKKVNKVCF